MISVILIEQKMTLENLAKLVKEEEKKSLHPITASGLGTTLYLLCLCH